MKAEHTGSVIVLDCLHNRIRIHRTTLYLLGNPDYIVLLVNPMQLSLVIAPSTKTGTAHAVRWNRLSNNRCFELYSKPLIRQLCEAFPGLCASKSFHLTGEHIREENVIRFDLGDFSEGRTPL